MRILNRVALERNIAPCFLEFIGVQDERKTVGMILYHFNVWDDQHEKYKSTIVEVIKD
jgi:hypothetical protein